MRSRNLSDSEQGIHLSCRSSLICWLRAAPRWTWSRTTTSGSGPTRPKAEKAEGLRLRGRKRPTPRSRPLRRGWPGWGRDWTGWQRACNGVGNGHARGGRAGPRTRRGELKILLVISNLCTAFEFSNVLPLETFWLVSVLYPPCVLFAFFMNSPALRKNALTRTNFALTHFAFCFAPSPPSMSSHDLLARVVCRPLTDCVSHESVKMSTYRADKKNVFRLTELANYKMNNWWNHFKPTKEIIILADLYIRRREQRKAICNVKRKRVI